MVCPKCHEKALKVVDVVHDVRNNTTLRSKKCKNCGYSLFTSEAIVEDTNAFRSNWYENHAYKRSKNKADLMMVLDEIAAEAKAKNDEDAFNRYIDMYNKEKANSDHTDIVRK